MAKKFAKTLVGIGAAAVAGKVAYDKYKTVKEAFTKEENESVDAEVKKYNAIFEKKVVEVEDEEFSGCEIKTVGAKAVLDLGLAVFEKDVYINFNSTASTLTIILPEGVNVACDIEILWITSTRKESIRYMSSVRRLAAVSRLFL